MGCGMDDPLILGVDPGLKVTGWVLTCGRVVVKYGSIRIPKQFDGDVVIEMAGLFQSKLGHLTDVCPFLCHGAVERYVYQGKKRATNPDGPLVAELVGRIATECDRSGVSTVVIPKNDALRAVVPSRRRGQIPSEKEANAMLAHLYGVRLSNQHEKDALMQCWAARQRWRAGR